MLLKFLTAESYKKMWQASLDIYLNNYIYRLCKCYVVYYTYTARSEKSEEEF